MNEWLDVTIVSLIRPVRARTIPGDEVPSIFYLREKQGKMAFFRDVVFSSDAKTNGPSVLIAFF